MLVHQGLRFVLAVNEKVGKPWQRTGCTGQCGLHYIATQLHSCTARLFFSHQLAVHGMVSTAQAAPAIAVQRRP